MTPAVPFCLGSPSTLKFHAEPGKRPESGWWWGGWMGLVLGLFVVIGGCDASDSPPGTNHSVEEQADLVVAALAASDWPAVARHVHPDRGLLFSPYAYVEPTQRRFHAADGTVLDVMARADENRFVLPRPTDPGTLVFDRARIAAFAADTTTYMWGRYDGKGTPIELTVEEYWEEFLYRHDFAQAQRGAPNEELGSGNSINNLPEVMGENAVFVEYYVPGTDEYSGMDWGSLRVVFEETDDARYLIGLVRDQWTI